MLSRLTQVRAAVSARGTRRAHLSRSHLTSNKVIPLTVASKELFITKTTSPMAKTPKEDLVFGVKFADHMLMCQWAKETGWVAPEIKPFENLSLHPASSVLHYGLESFEGMKAYKDAEGGVRLFRPMKNMARMATSAERLCFPEFGQEQFLECIASLVEVDQDWIPEGRGYSLYVRPTLIATSENLGVGPTTKCMLYVITSPVGPYYPTGFKPVSLFAEDRYIRAWHRGTGNYKIGGNYAPTILPQVQAAAKQYSQVLWLSGEEHWCTEVGTMNLMMLLKNKETGEPELVTAPLEDGTILPGVTRDSVLHLAREWNECAVVERNFNMQEVLDALAEGRMLEMFGVGTAVIVSPINRIGYMGKDYDVPLDHNDSSAQIGPFAKKVHDTLTAIQYGEIEHEWSYKI